MINLPKWIYFNGTTYYFKEWEADDERLKGWWFCGYWPNGDLNQLPPEVTNGHDYYNLVSSDPYSKELAEKDLLGRLNDMKPWLMLKT